MKIILILIFFFSNNLLYAKNSNQIEITTEEGIEVFNKEKYYLLKKNVHIESAKFDLKASLVKVFFEKDLYDIIKMNSQGNVKLISEQGVRASGENIDFDIKNEELKVFGNNSNLINESIIMKSDETIIVNNLTQKFTILGPKSTLTKDEIFISGSIIKGKFMRSENQNDFESLYVEDNEEINIKTNTLDMYALKANYDNKNNTIELFKNVKIYRNNEFIEGDYAKINVEDESYKVTSENSEKVKVILNEVN